MTETALEPRLPGFTDLPDEVLALVAALGLTEQRDVASFAATSKRCLAICRAAPLRLGVSSARAATPAAADEQAAARASLQALKAAWPGTAELDLHGTPLEDHDVATALQALPHLAVLQLSGCKKLTPALTGGSAAACGLRPPLRTIALQRCFQLTASALSDVLAAAAAPGSKLACAALSHLTLSEWPEPPPGFADGGDDVAPAGPPPGTLRMLALHNCSKLGAAALVGIAAACPRLEVLMLGGCSFAIEQQLDSSCLASSPGDRAPGSGLGAPAALFRDRALATLLRDVPMLSTSGSSLGFASYIASLAAHLAAMAARLPCLRVLELTFGLPGLAGALQHLADTEPLLLAGRPEPLQVWDLSTAASVARALTWRRSVAARRAAGASPITPGDASAFLSAAVNCSSAARATPLHVAAEEGSPWLLRTLVELGAGIEARDRSGATPLHAACEMGEDASVECLLGAGASASMRTMAGETPLYVCSLKGHERCVDLLLCQEVQQTLLKTSEGDGWTPLMAAAVAGRTSIVLKLLQAAGKEAPALVMQANRYGSTALHIAARKAGPSLLRSLVDAGGSAALLAADADGRLPADIAKRNQNGSALRLLGPGALAREQARQRGMLPTAERPRANDHRQQNPQQRWVGRRLQQRKGSGGQGSSSGTH